MVVFDVTNTMTLAHTAQWLEEAQQANSTTQPLVFLVATKRDLLVQYHISSVLLHHMVTI